MTEGKSSTSSLQPRCRRKNKTLITQLHPTFLAEKRLVYSLSGLDDLRNKYGLDSIGDWERTHFSREIQSGTEGEEVTLFGWVHILRDKGSIKFLVLRDEKGTVQVTLPKKRVPADVFQLSEDLKPEYAIAVKGEVVEAPQVDTGVEIIPDEIRIINKSERIPIDVVEGKVDIDLDTRLNHRILDLRKPRLNSMFRLQHDIVRFCREYLEKSGFMEIHTPKIVASATEGGASLFEVKYFDRSAFLAQSPQFYKQLMLLAGFGKVFEIGPVFRAEKHNTIRHINEYTSFDIEMAWIRDMDEVMELEERMLHYAFAKTRERFLENREAFQIDFKVPSIPFPRVKYEKVVDILNEEGKDISMGEDLDPESERMLREAFPKRFGSPFVFITHYPSELRPAYTMPSMSQPGLTESFDLTYKGMEITTGGQRIHIYDLLVEKFEEKGFNPEEFTFYLEPFKYGAPPHGGLGLGVERLTMQLLNLDNIREASLLPRDRDRLTP